MTITTIYNAARERGLVRSLRGFSREFLGRSANYASDTGLDRCSVGALVNLYMHLEATGQPDLQAVAFARLLDVEMRGSRSRAVAR